MRINFLEARQALTKSFTQKDGVIEVSSYPHASEFKSHHYAVTTLEGFYAHLVARAATGHCLLKGELSKELNFESRAGSTDPFTPTQYLVIDVDGLVDFTPDLLMEKLGMADVSYIIQYSSSQGVLPKKGLSCHIFVMLQRPAVPQALKQWLIKCNLDICANQLTLTRSGCALHYPLDITACQNDKLIYIAPPKCEPPDIDRFEGARIKLHVKAKAAFDFPDNAFPSESINRVLVEEVINNLRKTQGLKPRKTFDLKVLDDQEYLARPDAATVTGIREARGYTYLNVNGGDSWAYWHPTDRVEFIFNFKGEPVYRTAEFLPSYYSEYQRKHAPVRKVNPGKQYLAFRDFATSTYYNGWYTVDPPECEIYPAANKTQLQDFLTHNGIKPPKVIPDWRSTFDPTNSVQVDTERQIWNRFKPSTFMAKSYPNTTTVCPPLIAQVIGHVLGSEALVPAFLNWVAYAYQKRRATGTAWMLQGVPGTGKGLLIHTILQPIFGATNTTARRMEELEDKFNGYLEGCLLVYIDEVNIGKSKRSDMIIANLKNQITEPMITIRNMRQTAYESPNYLNWIFSSNMATPIELDQEDRRFNVGAYQKRPLREVFPNTTELIVQLTAELDQFAAFLHNYVVDEAAVRLPVKNEARQALIENSLNSLDIVANAILAGDLEALVDLMSEPKNPVQAIRADHYNNLITDLVKTRRTKITRDELFTIFEFTVGNVPESPAKFARFLSHHGIRLKKVRVGSKTTAGIELEWKYNPEHLNEPDVLPLVKHQDD